MGGQGAYRHGDTARPGGAGELAASLALKFDFYQVGLLPCGSEALTGSQPLLLCRMGGEVTPAIDERWFMVPITKRWGKGTSESN